MRRRGEVPIAPFRDRFVALVNRGELSAQEVARRLGWSYNGTGLDTGRVQRAFGLKPYTTHGTNHPRYQVTVTYEMAVQLAEVLEMDPMDAGI